MNSSLDPLAGMLREVADLLDIRATSVPPSSPVVTANPGTATIKTPEFEMHVNLSFGSTQTTLTIQEFRYVLTLVSNNEKIRLIKFVRAMFDTCGLKESKDFVVELSERLAFPLPGLGTYAEVLPSRR